MGTGIYAIIHTTSDTRYIGSARSITDRWKSHLKGLRASKHPNKYLQSAWIKYGAITFQFVILENCTTTTLIEREQHWIDAHLSSGYRLFNLQRTAKSNLGRTWTRNTPRPPTTDETRKKLSLASTGRKHTLETRAKMSRSNKGRPKSEAHKASIVAFLTGRTIPDIVKQKMSESAKKSWTPERRAKFSKTQQGHYVSAETRVKIGIKKREHELLKRKAHENQY